MHVDNITRICLWSGPRNISTALMYSFAQRMDTIVFDEPFYAHYLSKTNASSYHPGSEEILASLENDGNKVVEMILGKHPKPIAFFKHMTHHLVDLDLGFLNKVDNVILTRDPREMLPSYAKQVNAPTMQDVGYAAHEDLYHHLCEQDKEPIIMDSKRLLLEPGSVLKNLCNKLKITFDKRMLKWNPGPRPEDGIWAKYWYENVHRSTGFKEYKPKTDLFPEQLIPLLEECLPVYERLSKLSIT